MSAPHDTVSTTAPPAPAAKRAAVRRSSSKTTKSTAATTPRKTGAKKTNWTNYETVHTPAERVKYLQLCHEYIMSPATTNEPIDDAIHSECATAMAHLPPFATWTQHHGHVLTSPKCAPRHHTTRFYTSHDNIVRDPVNAPPSSSGSLGYATMCVPLHSDTTHVPCSYCGNAVSHHSDITAYMHASAPRTMTVVCPTCRAC